MSHPANTVFRIHIAFRWWLRWYIDGVSIMAWLTGAEPDWDKVEAVVRKAVVLRCDPVVFGIEA